MNSTALKLRLPRFLISVEFTREGLIFILLSLAIGAAAVNTGNNVLYFIFSLMLGMIVVSGIASRRALHGLTPVIQFPDHVFAGVPSLCYIRISNRKTILPSIAIRFVIRDPKFTSITRHFFFIPVLKQVSGYTRFTFPKRGTYQLHEMELQTHFPFSFFLKIRRFSAKETLRVYPRMYRLSEEVLSRHTEGMIRQSPYRGDSHQLLHLRDYGGFDSSKRIHWKASAKAEKLLVKEFQMERGRDVYLHYDCFPDSSDESLLEKALSFLASLAFLFKEKDMHARIILPGRIFDTKGSMIPLLSYLADWSPDLSQITEMQIPYLPESVVLQLRSRLYAPRMESIAGAHNLYVEDWQHLLREEDLIEI
jgi:uncharacterized protein (DUF58 family)